MGFKIKPRSEPHQFLFLFFLFPSLGPRPFLSSLSLHGPVQQGIQPVSPFSFPCFLVLFPWGRQSPGPIFSPIQVFLLPFVRKAREFVKQVVGAMMIILIDGDGDNSGQIVESKINRGRRNNDDKYRIETWLQERSRLGSRAGLRENLPLNHCVRE